MELKIGGGVIVLDRYGYGEGTVMVLSVELKNSEAIKSLESEAVIIN